MNAREGLDRQVNALVSLQIMIAVEALRALIALERPVILRTGLNLRVSVKLQVRSVATIETWHHSTRHTPNECHLTVWVADVAKNWTWHGVLKRTLMRVRRL